MGSEFRVLGKLEVLHEGKLLDLGPPRQQSVLARLLVNAGEPISADRLIMDIWGEEAAASTRHTLHVNVSRLRKALGRDGARLVLQGDRYLLRIDEDELDASRFQRLVHDGRAASARGDTETARELLHRGLELWRGRAFEGFTDEAFTRAETTRLEELRLDALECRFWADLELDRHAEVVAELQEAVAQHPFREVFAEQLMLALYRCGRQAEALRVFQTTRLTLAQELGIDPGPALRLMEERILAHDPSLESASHQQPVPRSLPLQRTSFIGRTRELSLGTELLPGSRLVTLIGPPGSGKTRLAIELAAALEDWFPGGIFFVPLAPLTDPSLFGPTVARVLGLREVPGEAALGAVAAFLGDRSVLLVLDNFEQILPAASELDELLRSTTQTTAMVTSRAPLRLYGEQLFPVAPLAVPPQDHLSELELVQEFDAVALFVARARAVDPGFTLSEENAGAVAAIVAGLDGLPLAIELAAARVKVLTPRDLLQHLTHRLAILADGPVSSDGRHQTMRDAIAWSYGLLDPGDAVAFRHLGVFRGGFTLEGAATVIGHDEEDALARIDSLLSKSLLYRTQGIGRSRFSMLELLREFALLELDEAGEAAAAKRRHAEYYERLARRVEPLLVHAPENAEVLELRDEVDNIRGALQFSLDERDADLGLGIASSIWRFWESADLLTEGRRWLEALLAQPEASPATRANGLTALAGLAYWQADREEALVRYGEALALYRSSGDQPNVADTLYAMSLTATFNDDAKTGEQLAEEADAAFTGLGSLEGVGKVTVAKGFARWKLGDLTGALEAYGQSVDIARACDDPVLACTQLIGVAALTFLLGDGSGAMRTILDVVDEAHRLGNAHVTVWALDLVSSFAASHLPAEAVRLAGAVHSLREKAGGGVELESLGLEDPRSTAMPALGADRLDEEWNAGRDMSIDDAVDVARDVGQRAYPD